MANEQMQQADETMNMFGSAFARDHLQLVEPVVAKPTPITPEVEIKTALPGAPGGRITEQRAVKKVPVTYRKTKVWVTAMLMPDDTMKYATENDEWTDHLEHAKLGKVAECVLRGERMNDSLVNAGQIEIRPVLIGEGMKVSLAPVAEAA